MNIHYDVTTGQIVSFGSAQHADGEESCHPGCKIMMIEDRQIDPRTQRINPLTKEIVSKDPDPEPDKLPKVKGAIVAELAATDQYMVSDRPLSDEAREGWRIYRQELRDLKGSAEEIVANWPVRPDNASVASLAQLKG